MSSDKLKVQELETNQATNLSGITETIQPVKISNYQSISLNSNP